MAAPSAELRRSEELALRHRRQAGGADLHDAVGAVRAVRFDVRDRVPRGATSPPTSPQPDLGSRNPCKSLGSGTLPRRSRKPGTTAALCSSGREQRPSPCGPRSTLPGPSPRSRRAFAPARSQRPVRWRRRWRRSGQPSRVPDEHRASSPRCCGSPGGLTIRPWRACCSRRLRPRRWDAPTPPRWLPSSNATARGCWPDCWRPGQAAGSSGAILGSHGRSGWCRCRDSATRSALGARVARPQRSFSCRTALTT